MTVVLDVVSVLCALSRDRPIFHSEADFQFAFAWEAKRQNPSLEVRLETHPEPTVRLDLEVFDGSGAGVVIELKYMTRHYVGNYRDEHFVLKNHGASDLRAYDVVKDIVRVERFVALRPGWTGLVIALTNDASYWRAPTHGRLTNADAFRLYDGTALRGERRWGPATGGTAKGRESALSLQRRYMLHWTDYSRLDESIAGTFRALVVPVS